MSSGLVRGALDAVVGRSEGVVWVPVGDEVVVYRVVPPTSFVLNPVAGLLWRCLDGVAPLREILRDMADILGAEAAQVEQDCTRLVDAWLSQHLVERVGDG